MVRKTRRSIWMIRPWIEDFSAYDHFSQHPRFLALAAFLRRCGFQIRYIDCLSRSEQEVTPGNRPGGRYREERIEKPDVFRWIPRYFKRFGMSPEVFRSVLESGGKPDVVLVTSGMTYWYSGAAGVIREIRRVFGAVPVALGGVYAALMPEHARLVTGADCVFPRGFDASFRKWLAAVTGLGKIKWPASLPPPAWDLVPGLEYIVIRTSSGCNHACDYCAAARLESSFHPGDFNGVNAELEEVLYTTGVKHVVLYDDDIGCDGHLKNFLQRLAVRNGGFTWHLPNAVSVESIDMETARLMRRIGISQPRLSLNHLDRKMTETGLDTLSRIAVKKAMDNLQAAGYPPGACSMYLIAGMPQQTLAMLENACNDLLKMGVKPYLAQFSPVPGTPLGDVRLRSLGFPAMHEPFLTNKILSVYAHPGWTASAFQALVAYIKKPGVC